MVQAEVWEGLGSVFNCCFGFGFQGCMGSVLRVVVWLRVAGSHQLYPETPIPIKSGAARFAQHSDPSYNLRNVPATS